MIVEIGVAAGEMAHCDEYDEQRRGETDSWVWTRCVRSSPRSVGVEFQVSDLWL